MEYTNEEWDNKKNQLINDLTLIKPNKFYNFKKSTINCLPQNANEREQIIENINNIKFYEGGTWIFGDAEPYDAVGSIESLNKCKEQLVALMNDVKLLPTNKIIIQNMENEKNFLLASYNAGMKENSKSLCSLNFNTEGIGNSLGLTKDQSKGIVISLAQKGLIDISLGAIQFNITKKGVFDLENPHKPFVRIENIDNRGSVYLDGAINTGVINTGDNPQAVNSGLIISGEKKDKAAPWYYRFALTKMAIEGLKYLWPSLFV